MKHVLMVDGYLVAERLLEGMDFEVHITETTDDMVIDKVVAPKTYNKAVRPEKYSDDIRKLVQGNIDHLKQYATTNGTTLAASFDQWEADLAQEGHDDPSSARIDLLNEI